MAAGALHAVRGVDLALAPGETLGLVGETGCGKSLSALALMDLLPRRVRRSARRMVLDGEDLAAASPRRMEDLRGDRMAMIFQEPMTSLNPAYTIGNQLAEALMRHRAVGAAAARDRAVELLEKVGITAAGERLRQYPHQLSGGLRQRVMIAMALMCGPRLLICDEPTTALDVTIQAQILLLLKALQREFGMAMIFITHDLGVVARIADRIAVMYAGEVVELASAAELFAAPGHPYTRGLLRCLPVPGRDRGEPLGVIPGMVPNLAQEIAGCAFANRCDRAADACRAAPPPWAPGAHRARCILAPRAVA
ncbi:MAG: ABC transporter ATP-binding protein [Alphaproteobacteria bacterium]|nr:ABC transporter ATP-binding protein [Alphaproteobacteria bacterium]